MNPPRVSCCSPAAVRAASIPKSGSSIRCDSGSYMTVSDLRSPCTTPAEWAVCSASPICITMRATSSRGSGALRCAYRSRDFLSGSIMSFRISVELVRWQAPWGANAIDSGRRERQRACTNSSPSALIRCDEHARRMYTTQTLPSTRRHPRHVQPRLTNESRETPALPHQIVRGIAQRDECHPHGARRPCGLFQGGERTGGVANREHDAGPLHIREPGARVGRFHPRSRDAWRSPCLRAWQTRKGRSTWSPAAAGSPSAGVPHRGDLSQDSPARRDSSSRSAWNRAETRAHFPSMRIPLGRSGNTRTRSMLRARRTPARASSLVRTAVIASGRSPRIVEIRP